MNESRLISQLILDVKTRVQDLKTDLCELSATDLYQVGKLQGRVHGLNESLSILESLIED